MPQICNASEPHKSETNSIYKLKCDAQLGKSRTEMWLVFGHKCEILALDYKLRIIFNSMILIK